MKKIGITNSVIKSKCEKSLKTDKTKAINYIHQWNDLKQL